MISEAAVLANVMDKTRELTWMYLNLLKDTDMHKVYEVDGKKLNSAFWIMAHLSVTENFLLLRSTGGENVKIPWARQFGLGSVQVPEPECPPLADVKEVFSSVHAKAISHIASLEDSFLDSDNLINFEFDGEKSVRAMIVHAIRHEAAHAGHLGWLCKLNGIKTI